MENEEKYFTITPRGLVLPRVRIGLTDAEQVAYETAFAKKYPTQKARYSLNVKRNGSNLFKVIELQRQGFPVASLEQLTLMMEQQNKAVAPFYLDAPEVVLRGKQDSSYEPNTPLAKYLAKKLKIKSFKTPFVIKNLILKEDGKSAYGLILDTTSATEISEAPELAHSNNGRKFNTFKEKGMPDLESANKDGSGRFTLFTKPDGISRLCAYFGDRLYSGWGGLAVSFTFGRVASVDVAGVVGENLVALKKETDALLQRQAKERADLIARLTQ